MKSFLVSELKANNVNIVERDFNTQMVMDFNTGTWNDRNLKEKLKELKNFDGVAGCQLVVVAYLENAKDSYPDNGYNENDYTFSHYSVYVKYKGVLLYPHKHKNSYKSCSFSLVDSFNDKHTRAYNDYEKQSCEVGFVGVPSEKKMDAWLNYLLQEEENKRAYSAKCNNKTDEFLKSLEPYKDMINWWGGYGIKGEIIKNGIKFSFEISSNHVHQKIETHFRDTTSLEVFEKLSDNKYTRK